MMEFHRINNIDKNNKIKIATIIELFLCVSSYANSLIFNTHKALKGRYYCYLILEMEKQEWRDWCNPPHLPHPPHLGPGLRNQNSNPHSLTLDPILLIGCPVSFLVVIKIRNNELVCSLD